MSRIAAALIAGSLSAMGAAWAQTPEASPPANVQALEGPDHVVITGRPVEDVARDFVGAIAAAPKTEDQLGRWDRRICPGLIGMVPKYGQPVLDRIAQRAIQVGLDVGEPGCSANILILVTTDPDGIAQQLFDEHRDALGWYHRTGRRTLGRSELKKFLQSDAPVRWWHVSKTVTRDGLDVSGTAGKPGAEYPIYNVTGGASRLSRSTRQDFASAFVIVDAREMRGFPLGALADYVAMVVLAQLDAEADTSDYATVLNLFDLRDAGAVTPAGMTEWDLAYLQGLYNARRDARSARVQERDIARSVTGELTPD